MTDYTPKTKRLSLSYPADFYLEAPDVDSPHHPDRLLESMVGMHSSDSGMAMREHADRDLGFEPWDGDYEELLSVLTKFGVRVTLHLYERAEDGELTPLHITNILPSAGGQL